MRDEASFHGLGVYLGAGGGRSSLPGMPDEANQGLLGSMTFTCQNFFVLKENPANSAKSASLVPIVDHKEVGRQSLSDVRWGGRVDSKWKVEERVFRLNEKHEENG